MEMYRSTEERSCPDCGAVLDVVAEDTFVCPKEGTQWVSYGPNLLLRPAVVTRSVLELPWESRRAAA